MPEMASNGAKGFFPANPDLADMLGDTDFDLIICIFFFFGSQITRFPGILDFQVAKLEGGGAISGRHSRTTELRRSKELGQDHETSISASPVWGITIDIPNGRPHKTILLSKTE